jgi:hypothetical protein
MLIPGWRGLHGDALATQIENALRLGGFGSTSVVERRVADPGASRLALALTVFTVPARMLTTLANEERGAWLIWVWLLAGAMWWTRRRRAKEK